MKIFDKFRKKQKDVLPEEVEKYYKSQKRAKVGVAWAFGFLTLVITLIIALGLFYGIRFAYNQITGSDDNTTEVAPDGANQSGSSPVSGAKKKSENESKKKTARKQTKRTSPRTGDRLANTGDQLPATGDPGL